MVSFSNPTVALKPTHPNSEIFYSTSPFSTTSPSPSSTSELPLRNNLFQTDVLPPTVLALHALLLLRLRAEHDERACGSDLEAA